MQALKPKKLLNCKGRLISLEQPVVMGILNLTPDSFYDGGMHNSSGSALKHAEKMLKEGAAIIDVGGQSTRPGAEKVGAEDELNRVVPVISALVKSFPEIIISIDTFYAKVADEAINAGAAIINDVSAGEEDDKMFETVIRHRVPYVLMHRKGDARTMQQDPSYNDVVLDIIDYFVPKVAFLRENGVADIILDPGFGFGKTLSHNYDLLNRLDRFAVFELPVLAGISRKSMIRKVTGTNPEDSLNGTTALNMVALMRGAKILRVHDVKEAVECIRLQAQLVTG